jgi:branched-chain amino acid transport system ATP-binding protein
MGKSTSLKTVMGLLAPRRGSVRWAGQEIQGWPSYRVAQGGLGLVPEGRQIFPNLSVRENLIATAHNRQGRTTPWTLEAIYQMFPRLKERERNLGNMLSGGEQQMLAIGRALMTNPRLLILDEATEGLAPLVRAEIWSCLNRLKSTGLSLILIDKNIGPLLKLADRHYVLEKGRVVWSGTSGELRSNQALLNEYMGV